MWQRNNVQLHLGLKHLCRRNLVPDAAAWRKRRACKTVLVLGGKEEYSVICSYE